MLKHFGKPFEAKPLTADRFILHQASPHGRILDVEVLECGAGRSVTRIRAIPRIACSRDNSQIDRLALTSFLDHSVSYALATVVDSDVGMSTYDLRMDFSESRTLVDDLIAESSVVILNRHSASVSCMIFDAAGNHVLAGSALMRLGSYPGGSGPIPEEMGGFDAENLLGPYQKILDITGEKTALYFKENNLALIGWEPDNVLHGGATAALLLAACEGKAAAEGETKKGKWLASLHVRFVRPASGARSLHAHAEVDRLGRAATYISAGCYHESGVDVATAKATFVAS